MKKKRNFYLNSTVSQHTFPFSTFVEYKRAAVQDRSRSRERVGRGDRKKNKGGKLETDICTRVLLVHGNYFDEWADLIKNPRGYGGLDSGRGLDGEAIIANWIMNA